MSLHPALPPPPLALAIHPAPPPRPRISEKDKERKAKADAEAKDKKDDKAKEVPEKGKQNVSIDKEKPKGKEVEAPPTPTSPKSDLPEPPTPAVNAVVEDVKEKKPKAAEKSGENDSGNQKGGKQVTGQGAKDNTDTVKANEKSDQDEKDESEIELEPLILLPPAPHRCVLTRIDLPPGVVYPPVDTDPRGAYHKYAKAVGNEGALVDITKDGWLAPQWKERTEREALKRLTGEWEKELEREIEKERKRATRRKVPETSEGLLLDLWNELTEAPNNELPVEDFWDRYDWRSAAAQKHLEDIKRPEKSATSEESRKDAESLVKGQHQAKEVPEVMWTRQGVEDTLATVGIQCAYNTERPPSRVFYKPGAANLLLAHGYFLLRLDFFITWKPEEYLNKGFEALITHANDRVFGQMVKAQLAEERKKKEKDYRERKERERRERHAKEEKDKDKKKVVVGMKEGKDDETDETPGTPPSNVQVRNGKSIAGPPTPDNSSDKAIIAVPVNKPIAADDKDDKNKAADRDAKHEADAELVPGPKPQADDIAKGKDQPVFDEKDGRALVKALNPNGPIKKNDIDLAMKALELAKDATLQGMSGNDVKAPARDKAGAKGKDYGPMFWMWSQSCEKWRWKNYKSDVHVVTPGGWEERDWEMFADGRGVQEWEADQAKIEKEEVDVHDWSV
ncbi:hypothetical protein L204_101569 [Cryptococcus depauperatus]|nr:hypothetical protein L204_04465 [Cryptococcus depauperatus CBS 7855]